MATATERYRQPSGEGPEEPAGPATPIDLHTHTSRSDGILEPRALVEAAAAAGVGLLAMTDHDTLAAVRELRAPDAAPLPAGLELVAGIELNTASEAGVEVHILGYGLDLADERLEARLEALRAERRVRFERIVARLREIGCSIDAALAELDLTKTEALGRPTIARALVAAGHATSVAEAFERLIGRGGPAYVPRPRLDPATAIALVREAGGLAVLAHPAEVVASGNLLAELVAVGLGGLEVHYRGYPPEVVAALAALAASHRLIATGGTDFHGDDAPYAIVARSVSVPAAIGERLLAALRDAAPPRGKGRPGRVTLVGR